MAGGVGGRNTYLTAELAGTPALGAYSGAANDPARVQILIDMIEPVAAENFNRGMLDEMSPMARIQLIQELRALKAAIT